jgi:hypothetical protein
MQRQQMQQQQNMMAMITMVTMMGQNAQNRGIMNMLGQSTNQQKNKEEGWSNWQKIE